MGGIAALVLSAAALAGSSGSASAAIYWEGGGTLGAANLDGTGLQPDYVQPPSPSASAGPQCGIAASGNYLYWVGSEGIGRVNLEGPTVPRTIVSGLRAPCGIAVDASHVFWASQEGTIGRANLDGSEANPALIGGLRQPCGVAVDGNYVYWLDIHGVGRAHLDGSDPEVGFIPGFFGNCSLAVNSQYLYWGDFRSIGRARVDGSEVEQPFIGGLGEVADGVAIDANHIYWSDRPLSDVSSSIGRANLDGSEINRQWIPTQPFEIPAVAVDGRPSPPPLALPPLSFAISKVSHLPRQGAAVLSIETSEPGELKVVSPGLHWAVLAGPEATGGEAFAWKLKIWANGGAQEGERIRNQLHKKGSAPLIAHVFFDGEIHQPVTLNRRLVLRRGVRRHQSRVTPAGQRSHRPASSDEYRAAGKFQLGVRLLVRANRIHYAQIKLVERCSDGSRKHGGSTFRSSVPETGIRIQPDGSFKSDFSNGSHGYEIFQGRFNGNRVVGLFKASHSKAPGGSILDPTCGTARPNGLPIHFSGHLTAGR